MFIDVHCHIDVYPAEKVKQIIENCRANGVGIIVNNGGRRKSNRESLKLALEFPEVRVALGLYPLDAKKMGEKLIDSEIEFIRGNEKQIIAIGEVGLDLFEISSLEKQTKIFEKMIDLAVELDKPIFVHSRKAEKEAIEILEKKGAKKVIMHCFSGKKALVKRIIDNRWFLSIPASVKYNQMFQDNARMAPLSQLFCETDSPFLHPDRERHNEPANVIESYKKIAEVKDMKLDEIEKIIEDNFRKLFGVT